MRSGEDVDDLVRAVDSETLLRELERRGIRAFEEKQQKSSSHSVGDLRPLDAFSLERQTELDANLVALGLDPLSLAGGPPLKAYNTYVRPRSSKIEGQRQQSAQNCAQQIAFLQRHEMTRRESLMRNTDEAARKRRAEGLRPRPLTLVLDNLRSAENVGSIFRTADCGRCLEILTCGLTPNPLSTAKLSKTAFGAETSLTTRHFDTTRAALEYLKQRQNTTIWALETHDSAQSHLTAPLPDDPSSSAVALVLGNEVTGVDVSLLPLVDAIVEIPTFGTKNSMNVAVAAGIVLYDILRRWNFLNKEENDDQEDKAHEK